MGSIVQANALPYGGGGGLTLELFFGILFGLFGSAYLLYGKRQGEAWFILAGFGLFIFPYFVSGVPLTLLVGGLLLLFPIAKHNEWL